jgi:hypothetical protein
MELKEEMFVITCKFNPDYPFILQLVKDIREYHPNEKVVVIDSNSTDKTYFKLLEEFQVIVEDIDNENWMIGGYWHAFKKYPHEDYYFFLHDSMRIKGNLDYLKINPLVTLCHFDRSISNFNTWSNRVETELGVSYSMNGKGCYGPIFFCRNEVMKQLEILGADKLLPTNKQETGYCEGMYGFLFEHLGYDLTEVALYGDVLENESPNGISGTFPHVTSWQFPIEKFYASHVDKKRSWEYSIQNLGKKRVFFSYSYLVRIRNRTLRAFFK